MRVLALECSTSSAKAAVFDERGTMLTLIEEAWPAEVADVVTMDAPRAAELLFACGARAAQGQGVEALALCTIWHSLLPLGSDLQPLSRCWTWANTEAAPTVARHKGDRALLRTLYQRTGCPPNSSYPLWQAVHRRAAGDESIERAAFIASLHGYLTWRLTGTLASNPCAESGSGFLDIARADWCKDALELAGFAPVQFPRLIAMDDALPLGADAAAALGLPVGLPVLNGGADGALNQIGAGATGRGIMTLSVGTSAALRLAQDAPLLPEGAHTWCYRFYGNSYLAGAATSGAGNCVNWFRDSLLAGAFPLEALEQMALNAVGDPPVFLPFPFGERAPGYDGSRRGGFAEMTGAHSLGHLYRAVLEGILFNTYHCYRILTERVGEPVEIRLSGGITRSPFWLQLAADLYGREMVLNDAAHASLAGAAALALAHAGALPGPGAFPAPVAGRVTPNPGAREALLRRYVRYLRYYNLNAEGNHLD